MMKRINILLSCCLLCALLSCVKEVDLEYLRPTPKLVLNCFAKEGEQVIASLSRTWFYTDEKLNITIQDAEIKLYVNEKLVETMGWSEDVSQNHSKGYYFAEYKPQPGDNLKVTASVEGYESIVTETSIPLPVPLDDFHIERVIEKDQYGGYVTYSSFHITFTDVLNRKDYYLLYFEEGIPVWDPESGEEFEGEYMYLPYSLDYAQDPLFGNEIPAFDKVMGYDWLSGYYGRVFTDDLIDGKTYTIKLPAYTRYWYPDYPEEGYGGEGQGEEIVEAPPLLYRVSLYTVSESYYNYMKSVLKLTDESFTASLADSGLGEPIRVYSNIVGGVGIFGGGNGSSITIKKAEEDTW